VEGPVISLDLPIRARVRLAPTNLRTHADPEFSTRVDPDRCQC